MLLALCFKENITILTKPYDRKRDSILDDVGLKRRWKAWEETAR